YFHSLLHLNISKVRMSAMRRIRVERPFRRQSGYQTGMSVEPSSKTRPSRKPGQNSFILSFYVELYLLNASYTDAGGERIKSRAKCRTWFCNSGVRRYSAGDLPSTRARSNQPRCCNAAGSIQSSRGIPEMNARQNPSAVSAYNRAHCGR